MILCDTNIFFELFRGNQSVLEELAHIGYRNLAVSDSTIGGSILG
jgi:predicted nucleic acid-binding protein